MFVVYYEDHDQDSVFIVGVYSTVENLNEVIDRHERFAEENGFDRDYYYEKVEFDDMEA